jgi:hypothetical protein
MGEAEYVGHYECEQCRRVTDVQFIELRKYFDYKFQHLSDEITSFNVKISNQIKILWFLLVLGLSVSGVTNMEIIFKTFLKIFFV